eukprot:1087881-Rhodomonas_salina.1
MCIRDSFAPVDAFVDPCRCSTCDAGSVVATSFLVSNLAQCRLRVDPRTLAQGWGAGLPQTFVDDVLARLQEDEVQAEESAPYMTDESCEGIVDWWPE